MERGWGNNTEEKCPGQKKMKRTTINHSKSWSSPEDTVYLVGLEGHCILQTLSAKSATEFGQVLIPVGPMKSLWNWQCPLPLAQHQTLCLFVEIAEICTAC